MTLGERIKTARKNNGMTQSELARLIGVSQTHISKVESNRETPSEGLLKSLSGILGISPEVLANGDNFDLPSKKDTMATLGRRDVKFKNTGIPPKKNGIYCVFAPELDSITTVKTQGGFAIASYEDGKWLYLTNDDSVSKIQDITQYVKAWISFQLMLEMLPVNVLQWYAVYGLTKNESDDYIQNGG